MDGEGGGNDGASQTPKGVMTSSAESPEEKVQRSLAADLLQQAQPDAIVSQQEAAALAEQQLVAAEALRVATERALAVASPKAGGQPIAKAAGVPLVPAPPLVAARILPQPPCVGRATGVWVTNGVGLGNFMGNVNDLPNMPDWVKCDGAQDLDKDLVALCDQLKVPKLFQHWLAYWRMHST